MPENVTTLTKSDDVQSKNEAPKKIPLSGAEEFKDGEKCHLFHVVDRVHIKPITVVNILLRMN